MVNKIRHSVREVINLDQYYEILELRAKHKLAVSSTNGENKQFHLEHKNK